MSTITSGSKTGPTDAHARARWNDARRHVFQLEHSTARLSSRWFLGMTGLAVAAALFVFSAIILAICLVRLQDHFGTVQQDENILNEAVALQEDLDEAPAAARGYVATRDESFLKVRKEATLGIWRHLDTLSAMLHDDREAEQIIREVGPDISKRVRLFDDMIVQSGQPNSAVRVQTGETERIGLAHDINRHLAQLRTYERSQIIEHERLVHLDLRLAIGLVLFTGVIAPLCGLFGIYLLRRERDTQRARQLQLELMHVQRLAIMGQTAAMLAHELNQPLTAAMNFLGVLRRSLDNATEKGPPLIERIGQQIQRVDAIVRKLRRFIEKRETERSLETADVLIEDAISLLGTIDSTVALKTNIPDDLPCILVDRVQLQQVLVNLMRNAIEAMQDSPRRELTLSAAAVDHSVEISLADTGPGLSSEVAERLFQPFVSTKDSGMGVGLSICQTIIAEHQGRIWADPNPGGGTIFRFTLPAVEERAAA
jgi:C4-dicarboxylate-specific signal transduction histidine kinase